MAISDFSTFQRSLPYEELTEFKILTSEFENGIKQKRDKWHTNKKSFNITFKVKSKTDALAIRDYFIAREGSANTFEFTEPLESTTYTVRFRDDKFRLQRQYYNVYNCSIILETVL